MTSRSLYQRLSDAYVLEKIGHEWQFEDGPPIIASRADIVASFEKRARSHPWEALLLRQLYRGKPG